MGVVVTILGGRGQRYQIVGQERERLIGIVCRMHHRALLVERDIARAIHRQQEHHRPARARAAFDLARAVDREHHRSIGRGIDQTGRAGIDAQRIGKRA